MSKLINFFWLYPKIIVAVALVAAVAGGVFWFNSGNGEATVTVKKQDLLQTVQASGKIRAGGQVDLSFAKGGRVAEVKKQPGERVYVGEVIVALDQADLYADRASALATLKQNEAKVASAKVALTDAKRALANALAETFAEADSVMGTTIDEFYDSAGWDSANTVISFQGSNLRERLGSSRSQALRNLASWEKAIGDGTDVTVLADQAQNYLDQFVEFLSDLAFAVNNLDNTTDEAAIAAARTSINTLVSELTAADEKYRAAAADIAVQEAAIDSARATIAKIDAEINKGLIKAPLNGLVTKQEAKAGESVEANVVLTSVIAADQNFEIESYIPEVNITKISVGNEVKITFDALPGETFTGKVAIIDQGETIRDGVPNFKIKVVLKTNDGRIKTGLSANLTIESAKKEAVLVLPIYALTREAEGKAKVWVKEGSAVSEREIVTGQTGDAGLIEIVSGLKEGEVVVATPVVE